MELKAYDHIVKMNYKYDFDSDFEIIKNWLDHDQDVLEDFRRYNSGELKVTIPDTRLKDFTQPDQIDIEAIQKQKFVLTDEERG